MEDYFEFLNDLRDSGQINMFGAASFYKRCLDLTNTKHEKSSVLWMKSFEG